MRYIIIGAGAVGLALAAEFELAGIDYQLIGRGAQLAKLQADGLEYERPAGSRVLRLNVSDRMDLRSDDVLLLTVKTQDVEAATAHWADEPVQGGGVAADLPLVTLQNGLESERIAARRFSRLYAASIMVPAVYIQTGKVSVASAPQLASVVVGRFPHGTDAVTAQIVADLSRANSLAEERGDIQRWKAAKILHNVKNALELFAGDADTHALLGRRIMDEARLALIAAGYDPARPDERAVDISHWKIDRPTDVPTGQSTWQSFTRGARSEVDYLNGEIARLGLMYDVATPWNRAAQRLAAQLARSGGAPGSIPLTRLRELVEQPEVVGS
ncbi:ketopantoate reductase family protein [Paracoccus laeviglucosivorans]|uniref:2-dehydropantoate 2-reductase n=1 Tax=Paracoccus laeviglucosivorans TaxID=1197861 RepID=A0A521EMV6_9RHOB|nr:2-dehydropantoate 2-reductase N-terminal domain-containing protein [Paracoccus laeviglucosivorans]SMO85265.1 2-dehydropantoate 2-reductase [Paracoccus laeviglucosivorans]